MIAANNRNSLTPCRGFDQTVTIRPQNSSQAQNLKTQNPNHKLIIQNSTDQFVWGESSFFRYNHILHSLHLVPIVRSLIAQTLVILLLSEFVTL